MSHLHQTFFSGNRRRLIDESQADLIAVAANGKLQRAGSTDFAFQQDSNFFYLTGINEPNMVLVIDAKAGKEYLIAGRQSEASKVFDGTFSHTDISGRSGITEIFSNREGWLKFKSSISHAKKIHIVEPPKSYIEHYSMYTNPARADLKERIKRSFSGEFVDLTPTFAHMRVIKQPPEIEAIKAAVDTTSEAFKYVSDNIDSYEYEYEIESDMVASFTRKGLDMPSYNSIVASGINACTLHYTDNNAKINKAKPIVIDVGAQVDHYSADITRTFIPDDDGASKVFKIVEEIQQECLKMIRPGLDFHEYEDSVKRLYGESLNSLGVINNALDDSIRKYAPHATSHFLGLDVHDLGDHNQEFSPGMVITVEPGIYIPEQECGVRIEDDVLITAEGVEVLSSHLPTRLETLK